MEVSIKKCEVSEDFGACSNTDDCNISGEWVIVSKTGRCIDCELDYRMNKEVRKMEGAFIELPTTTKKVVSLVSEVVEYLIEDLNSSQKERTEKDVTRKDILDLVNFHNKIK